jgi:hypothetical protein
MKRRLHSKSPLEVTVKEPLVTRQTKGGKDWYMLPKKDDGGGPATDSSSDVQGGDWTAIGSKQERGPKHYSIYTSNQCRARNIS